MGRIRATQWNLVFHYLAFALIVVQGIVLVPLYLAYIPLDQYGAWIASGNVLAWITVVDPGISTALMQRVSYVYGAGRTEEIFALGLAGFLISVIVAGVIVMVGWGISGGIPEWMGLLRPQDARELRIAFVVAVIGTALLILSYPITAVNQGLQSSVGIGLVYVTATVLAIVVTIVMLREGQGVLSLAVAVVIRGGGLLIGNLAYFIWRTRESRPDVSFSMDYVREFGRLSAYTFTSRLITTVGQNCEAFVVSTFLGPAQSAIMSLTRRAPDASRMLVERPSSAFMPAMAHLIGEGDRAKAKAVVVRLICIQVWLAGLLVGGFLSWNEDFVGLWVGKDLFAGTAVNVAICAAFAITVWSGSLGTLSFAIGNVRGNAVISSAEGIVAIILVVVATKAFGIVGAVAAPAIASVALGGWYYPRVLKRNLGATKADSEAVWKQIILAAFSASVMGVMVLRLRSDSWGTFCLNVLVSVICYSAVLALVSRRMRHELANGYRWLSRRVNAAT